MYKKNLSTRYVPLLLIILLFQFCNTANEDASSKSVETKTEVIAYYSGDGASIDQYDLSGVSQLIYSFLHLRGNNLAIDNKADSLTLMHLTGLKKKYPDLKVLLSLGGWGGCKTCSEVFSTSEGRNEFALSTAKIIQTYNADKQG